MNTEYYFDWAATAPIDKEILMHAAELSLEYSANPSSVHNEGIKARHLINEARIKCAKSLGVKAENLYFTSGGTESDHIPLLSLLERPTKGSILVSVLEHPAIHEQAEMMKKCGWKVIYIPCNSSGIVTPDLVISKLEDDTALVCVMAVNNETGAIQPIYEIADALTQHCKGHRRPKFHVDAVQAIGKIPLNLSYKGIDSAAISGHKICGPRGIGLLYLASRIEPFLRGGGQENGIRSGTENLLGILALADCLEKYAIPINQNSVLHIQKERTAHFISKLRSIPGCTIIPLDRADKDNRFSPGVVQASFQNIPGEVMVRALSEQGFCISTGSACSSRKNTRPILSAMGINSEIAANAVRFSFSTHSTDLGIEALLKAINDVANKFNG